MNDESPRAWRWLETYPPRERGKRMGIMFQNPMSVVGMEEEPFNRSCDQRGNIAGSKLYYYFYLLPPFAFLLMLSVGKD